MNQDSELQDQASSLQGQSTPTTENTLPPDKPRVDWIARIVGGAALLAGIVVIVLLVSANLPGPTKKEYRHALAELEKLHIAGIKAHLESKPIMDHVADGKEARQFTFMKLDNKKKALNRAVSELGNTRAIIADRELRGYYEDVRTKVGEISSTYDLFIEQNDEVISAVSEAHAALTDPLTSESRKSIVQRVATSINDLIPKLKQDINREFMKKLAATLKKFSQMDNTEDEALQSALQADYDDYDKKCKQAAKKANDRYVFGVLGEVIKRKYNESKDDKPPK